MSLSNTAIAVFLNNTANEIISTLLILMYTPESLYNYYVSKDPLTLKHREGGANKLTRLCSLYRDLIHLIMMYKHACCPGTGRGTFLACLPIFSLFSFIPSLTSSSFPTTRYIQGLRKLKNELEIAQILQEAFICTPTLCFSIIGDTTC